MLEGKNSERDAGVKNFAFALVDGRQMSLDEIAKTAPHIRRMYTGMYKPVKEILADDIKSFMRKLDKDPEKLRRV